jgi:hypothetical protein
MFYICKADFVAILVSFQRTAISYQLFGISSLHLPLAKYRKWLYGLRRNDKDA